MGISKYYYNPQTCQYERVGFRFWKTSGYVAGVGALGTLFFFLLLSGADAMVESDREKYLRHENTALKKYGAVLASRMNEVERSLDLLHEKDREIREKLFENPVEIGLENPTVTIRHADVLKLDLNNFINTMSGVYTALDKVQKKATTTNGFFGRQYALKQGDHEVLLRVPTLPPVADLDLDLVVSGFGIRVNPYHKGNYMHQGLDFAAPRGSAVLAAAPGRVKVVKHSSLQAGYGTYVEIDHGNGFTTRYAHLEDTRIKAGDQVSKGQVIATIGNSGGSIAPHLHYEILQDGKPVDPVLFMVEGVTSKQYQHLLRICRTVNQSLD